MKNLEDPQIITGGMGIWISSWVMSRIVSMMGGIGVVSGTALDIVYARILQDGDKQGDVRRAFAELVRRQPLFKEPIEKIIKEYFIPGGKAKNATYKAAPSGRLVHTKTVGNTSFWTPSKDFQFLNIAANFTEVWLAKEGHNGKIGINYLRKVERPLLWGLYGAILAGVNYVAIGAGSPAEIPAIIRSLSEHQTTDLKLRVYGATSADNDYVVEINPKDLGISDEPLPKPKFLAIVSSYALAKTLADNPVTKPYGFIIEKAIAGGHNAPPSKKTFDANGGETVVYTKEDTIDIKSIASLGLPFWLAGGYGEPQKVKEALEMGASGVQIGTIAALSGQSGMDKEDRDKVIDLILNDSLKVETGARTSPSGFPFKVAMVKGTLADPEVYANRKRVCDIGFLQSAYLTKDGSLGFRCPAENVNEFVRKGGHLKQTEGRVCLCNGLLAAAGFPQVWPNGYKEPSIITLGDEFKYVKELLKSLPSGQKTYTIGKALQFVAKAIKTCSDKKPY